MDSSPEVPIRTKHGLVEVERHLQWNDWTEINYRIVAI